MPLFMLFFGNLSSPRIAGDFAEETATVLLRHFATSRFPRDLRAVNAAYTYTISRRPVTPTNVNESSSLKTADG